MATKITITADGSQAKSEIGAVAAGMDRMGDQATQAAAETEAAGERIEDALEEVQREAKQTASSVGGIGGPGIAAGVTAASAAFLAMGKALGAIGRLAGEALQGIEYLSEQGNPAARRVTEALDECTAAMQRMAADPSMQKLGDSMASVFAESASTIEMLPEIWRTSFIQAESYWIQFQQAIGMAEDDAMQKFGMRIAAQRVEIEQQKKRIANEQEAVKAADEAKKLAEERAKSEKQAADEQSQADLDAFNDSLRMDDEEFNRKNAHIAELVKNQEEANSRLLEAEREMHEQRERDEQERIAKQKAALAGTGVTEGLNAKASDPRAIAERLAQQAADARRNELMAGGEQDSGRLEREAEAARRQAFRQARVQAQGGKETFSQDQIRGAIDANASAGIQAMQEAGSFSAESLQALSEAAAEQRRMSEEMRVMQDQLAQLRQFQSATTQDGQRRRSQRNSNRQ